MNKPKIKSPRVRIPFVGATYKSPSLSINAQECVNFYIDVDSAEGKSPRALVGRWGHDIFSSVGVSPIRGSIVVNSFAYLVAYDTFYKLQNDNTWKDYPAKLTTNSGFVGMASNGQQIMIVDGVKGYVYDIATDALSVITDINYQTATDVTYSDGYFITVYASGAQSSALYDGTAWNAIDVAAAESDPDRLIRVIGSNGDLYMLSENTVEVSYDAALPTGFPFVRYAGGVIDLGLAAKWGAIRADNTVYWIAKNKQGFAGFFRVAGLSPQKISPPAIDAEISSYANMLDCITFSFTDRGHTFVIFTFPSAGKSWMFDAFVAARLGPDYAWTEIRSWKQPYFRAAHHMYLNGYHYLCDLINGYIYRVNWSKYTDNGDVIEGIRTCQHLDFNGLPLEVNKLQVLMESGVGLTASGDPNNPNQGQNPLAMLFYSKDGAKTFGNGLESSIGQTGNYGYGVTWNRLGTSDNWTFRIRITDPIKRVILGAFADIAPGLD